MVVRTLSEIEAHRAKGRAATARYRARNPGKELPTIRAWQAKNKERIKATRLIWRLANKDRINAARRARAAAKRPAKEQSPVTPKLSKSEQLRSWKAANKERVAASERKWREENRAAKRALIARRRAAKLVRTPTWADQKAIKAIYAEALRLTRETGIKHQVDHVIPLQGRFVSGLHIETNLQILTATANHEKFNRFETYRQEQHQCK